MIYFCAIFLCFSFFARGLDFILDFIKILGLLGFCALRLFAVRLLQNLIADFADILDCAFVAL